MRTDDPLVSVVSWNYSAGSRHCVAATIKLLAQKGMLHRLITNDLNVVDGSFSKVNRKRRISTRLWQEWARRFRKDSRQGIYRPARERIIDWFAAANLGFPQVVFVDSEGFCRTIRQARKIGAVTVTYQRTANLLHAKKVLEEEESLTKQASFYSDTKLLKHRSASLQLSDHIIVPSEMIKRGDIDSGIDAERISVVRGCVDSSLYKPPEKPDHRLEKVVLFVGHEPVTKGLRVLLRAWHLVSSTCKDAELWLAGELPNGIEIPPGVKRLGDVSDMSSLYKKAAILAHPAILDAWPKTVTEAMASELAVVVSRGTGTSEMITNGVDGFVFDTGDSDDLAQLLIQLLNDPHKRSEIAARGRETTLTLTHCAHAKRVIDRLCSEFRISKQR